MPSTPTIELTMPSELTPEVGTTPTTAPLDPPPFDPALAPVFAAHEGGKLEVRSRQPIDSRETLSLVYTPGVAEVSRRIAEHPSEARKYLSSPRTVAVVSDGTAVLGLGDIGPVASLPVMEGKCCLFKEFAGLDAFPIVLNTKDVDEIVETVARIAPSFGGINLEDISAPRCFEVEDRLKDLLNIPVMHDDQHGTAIVVTAALRNARLLTGRPEGTLTLVIAGAGAAGIACAKMLHAAGVADIIMTDSRGVIHRGRTDLNSTKQALLDWTNADNVTGTTEDALRGRDVFLGLSGGTISESAVASMAKDAIVFSLSNPTPEVHPDIAGKYAAVVATGRSDFPNQINNVLAFPGVFRGAFDVGATAITDNMKLAASQAIADVILGEVTPDKIIPSPFDPRVVPAVTEAVKQAWLDGKPRRVS